MASVNTMKLAGLIGLAAISGLLLGCDGGRSTSDNAAGGGGGGGAGGGGQERVYTFGVIAKSQSNAVFQAARVGATDAAKELSESNDGVRIVIDWRTPNEEDAQKQAQYVEQLVAAGVDGIAISCSDANLLTGAINDAVNRGVEVVTFDSDAPESKRFAYYGVDDFAAGQEVMKQLAEQMNGEGTVAVLAGNQAAPNLQRRVAGVQDEAGKHPGITIKGVFYHAETPGDAVAKMQSVQTANPDITGWALVGGWPLYTDNALDGIYQNAKIVSMDPLRLPLNYVKAGQVQVLVGQPYYGWGTESIKLLFNKVHKGESPDEVMNYAEFDIVTQENAAEFEANWDKWEGK